MESLGRISTVKALTGEDSMRTLKIVVKEEEAAENEHIVSDVRDGQELVEINKIAQTAFVNLLVAILEAKEK